jgi:DNA ligase D-like protein (predicted 3'-phosphoesterase)
VFVVQRHDASSLHYDFRLEIDGVLASWAVPKGPSLDPREKRLATRTEDHPLDYADFEGTIPADEYGGGTVVVWDTGRFRNLTERDGDEIPLAEALDAGHLKVWLDGTKLSGAFALTHTKMRGDERNWLLVKVDDGEADRRRNPTSSQPESVLSGRTNADLEKDS